MWYNVYVLYVHMNVTQRWLASFTNVKCFSFSIVLHGKQGCHFFHQHGIVANYHLDESLGGGFKDVFSPRILGKWSNLTCADFSNVWFTTDQVRDIHSSSSRIVFLQPPLPHIFSDFSMWQSQVAAADLSHCETVSMLFLGGSNGFRNVCFHEEGLCKKAKWGWKA